MEKSLPRKKAIITGVAGFIGPHLAEACLNRGWNVVGVDISDYSPQGNLYDILNNRRFIFKKRDVRDMTLEELDGVDYIFHLAFVTNIKNSIEHPLETTNDNIDMTAYLLDLSAKAGIKKFLFPSTSSLYGNNPTPWTENMPPDPIEPYCWQKLAGEYACKMWTNCYGLNTVVLKLFQVFGENQRKDTVIAIFSKLKKEGKPITLMEASPGSPFKSGQRDFVYVKEAADAFIRAAESENTGKGEVINIAMGKATAIDEIAKEIGGEIVFVPKRSFEVERHEADITLAEQLLGWHPKVDVIEWLKQHSETL